MIKHLILLKIVNMMDINASMVYKFFNKKDSCTGIKNENISNKQLAEELHKPVIKKINKRKVHSTFADNIWGADWADMQLINKFDREFRFLLSFIDISSKYALVIPLKGKKRITLLMLFKDL